MPRSLSFLPLVVRAALHRRTGCNHVMNQEETLARTGTLILTGSSPQ